MGKETFAVTVKHISGKQIKNIEIPLPTLDEQGEIVAKFDKKKHLIEQKSLEIENLRQETEDYINSLWGE